MGNLQESWKKLRHSKWSTVIAYALIGVGLAFMVAQIQLMADFSVEYYAVDWSDREPVSENEWHWRNLRLSLVSAGVMAVSIATLLIIRSKWKPSANTVHAIPVGFVASVVIGTLGIQLFTPATWTDQVFEGLADIHSQTLLPMTIFVIGVMAGPYLVTALWRREKRAGLHGLDWQMWTAVALGGLMIAFFAISMVFGADVQVEWDQYVHGSDMARPDDSGLRDANTLRLVAVGLNMVMIVLAFSTKDRNPIHMYSMSASVLLGFFIGIAVPLLIAPDAWTDQSLEGLIAHWQLYLILPVAVISIAIFASTFGVKMARDYQARKRKALAE